MRNANLELIRRCVLSALLGAALPAWAVPPPDLNGVWGVAGMWDPATEAKVDPKLLQTPASEPPAFRPPYQTKYDARKKESAELQTTNRADASSEIAQHETTCLPSGMPGMMTAVYSLEFLQTKNQLTVLGEAYREVRRIYLNKPTQPIDEVPPGYWGRSVGRWEGDTLVVNTVGIKPEVVGPMGLFHSDQMQIEERIRLRGPDVLQNQITVRDPIALAKPFTFTIALVRLKNYETPEFVCDDIRETVNDKGELTLKSPPR
jgi:hypothetical protein